MKHIAIPVEPGDTRDFIIGALALFLLVLAGCIFWEQATRMMMAGVPPRVNSNGTIDYTLVDVGTGPGGQASKTEWVIRFPGEFQVYPSREEEPDRMAMNALTLSNNHHLLFSVDMKDLTPARDPASPNTAIVKLHSENAPAYWPALQSAQYKTCVSRSQKMGSVVEYTDADPAKPKCILGNSQTSHLYALTWNGTLQATLTCLKAGTTCDYELRHGDRAISGTIVSAKLGLFEDFQYRLRAFLERATVFDR